MFDFISKKEKNISNQELINQLKIETMTLEELVNLRKQIENEINRRNVNSLELPDTYKCFKTYDLSKTRSDKVISFIVNENGLLLGIDQYLNFYCGKLNDNFNIYLIEFSKVLNYKEIRGFIGTLDLNQKYFTGDYRSRINNVDVLTKLQNLPFDNTKEIYKYIENEKIINIEPLLKLTYKEVAKRQVNKVLIDELINEKNKYKKTLKK